MSLFRTKKTKVMLIIFGLFIQQPTNPAHNTRRCTANNFYIQYSRLNKHIESFVKLGAKIWNNISDNVLELGKNKFTKTIH